MEANIYNRPMGNNKYSLNAHFLDQLHGTDGLAKTHLGIPKELFLSISRHILATSWGTAEMTLCLFDSFCLFISQNDFGVVRLLLSLHTFKNLVLCHSLLFLVFFHQ